MGRSSSLESPTNVYLEAGDQIYGSEFSILGSKDLGSKDFQQDLIHTTRRKKREGRDISADRGWFFKKKKVDFSNYKCLAMQDNTCR